MANSMKLITKKCFPKAMQVTDRFHVQKLALEAVQGIRIRHRWEAMDLENTQIKQAKENNKKYVAPVFVNGDSRKQLLARSRYLLYKAPSNWTKSQKQSPKILFKEYPDIKIAFGLSQGLRNIFNKYTSIQIAYTKLAHWHKEVEKTGLKTLTL